MNLKQRASKNLFILSLLLFINFGPLNAQTLPTAQGFIEDLFDIYLTIPDGQQIESFEKLMLEAEQYKELNPELAEAWIACALIHTLYAGDQINPLKAAKEFKVARDQFSQSIELDASAMKGYATAFLGRLYTMMPGWPVSYGSDRKSKQLLQQALDTDANTMSNNAYYGEYLLGNKLYQEA
ncbi:MAG: hypothetical protein COC19_03380, partial [SAR86 cluster bacterium]